MFRDVAYWAHRDIYCVARDLVAFGVEADISS
jgi:hypothetical protein